MPRKHPGDLLPTHRCDGTWKDPETGLEVQCPNQVSTRKPSKTGRHYCPRPACQAAKQRFFRARMKAAQERAADEGQTLAILALIGALAHQERVTCPACGLEDALAGWYHRASPGAGTACMALGSQGAALPVGALDTIWPDRAPQRPALPPAP